MKQLKALYYRSLRLNWRAGFCMVVWFCAPYIGLEPEILSTVQNTAATFLVAAFLDWARRNGHRADPVEKARGIGVLGTRQDDTQKGE